MENETDERLAYGLWNSAAPGWIKNLDQTRAQTDDVRVAHRALCQFRCFDLHDRPVEVMRIGSDGQPCALTEEEVRHSHDWSELPPP